MLEPAAIRQQVTYTSPLATTPLPLEHTRQALCVKQHLDGRSRRTHQTCRPNVWQLRQAKHVAASLRYNQTYPNRYTVLETATAVAGGGVEAR